MSHQHTPDISLKPEVNREMDKEHARVDYYAVLSLVKTEGEPASQRSVTITLFVLGGHGWQRSLGWR